MKLIISDIENLNLNNCNILDYNINYCKGCFNCWIKSPMKCIFNDKCKDTSKYFLTANDIIIISKNIYGSFSSKVKQILERNIGYVYPFFTIREKEIHHKMRNNNKPNVIVIFYGNISKNDKILHNELLKRNKINFNYNNYKIFYCNNENDVRSKINDIIY